MAHGVGRCAWTAHSRMQAVAAQASQPVHAQRARLAGEVLGAHVRKQLLAAVQAQVAEGAVRVRGGQVRGLIGRGARLQLQREVALRLRVGSLQPHAIPSTTPTESNKRAMKGPALPVQSALPWSFPTRLVLSPGQKTGSGVLRRSEPPEERWMLLLRCGCMSCVHLQADGAQLPAVRGLHVLPQRLVRREGPLARGVAQAAGARRDGLRRCSDILLIKITKYHKINYDTKTC